MHIPGFDLKFSERDIEWLTKRFEGLLRTGFISMGENVANFESQFATFCGVRHAVGVSSGTGALETVLRAIDVRDATVLLPSHTFMATAAACIHAGARVILVDCQPDNFQMDPEDLETSIQPDSKVVILVHMAGIISPHIDHIRRICEKNRLILLEDSAHAHGATIDGRKAGSIGHAGCFSFFSTKVMTTGEGGMVTTSDPTLDRACRAFRDHGRFTNDPNWHEEFAGNARPSEILALLGLRQLAMIEGILIERRNIARCYDSLLGDDRILFVTRLKIPSNIQSAYYKYVVYLDERIDRLELRRRLKADFGVSLAGELYARAVHSQPVFEKYPEKIVRQNGKQFPGTDFAVNRHICLPLYPGLSDGDVQYVVQSLARAIQDCVS
jgi:dTDP-4-amino-4,6-dideoxygalactose transaminase